MMRDKLLSWCREEELFAPGDRVICAVSGGADSMALLWNLTRLGEELQITVSAAHFNHHLRGEEALRDECFVRDFCQNYNIPFYFGEGDVKAFSEERGCSLEDAARRLRYDFLLSLPCDKVATAHTADDNAETVLLHLLRGSGLRGLSGIPVKRGKIVRPLLGITKAELTAQLSSHGIGWVEDSTNAEDDCLRNRLRHHVMPLLYRETPELGKKLTTQSHLLRQEDAYLDQEARRLLCPTKEGFSVQPFREAPEVLRRRAIRLILRQYLPQDVSQTHVRSVERLVLSSSPSAVCSLPAGIVASRSYDDLLIHTQEVGSFEETALSVPGTTALETLNLTVSCEFVNSLEKTLNFPFLFALRCDRIDTNFLRLRPRQVGDSLILRNGHRRTVKKLMIDQKIPRRERDRMPVLVCGDQVLAVIGIGAGEDVCAPAGRSALVFRISKDLNKEQ